MGNEAQCTAQVGKQVSAGKALLETDELIFRGEFRLKIPYREIKSVEADGGVLRIRFPEGEAKFTLGEHAAKWADRILHPKSLLDKLGVKPGSAVAVLQVRDPDFLRQLKDSAAEVSVRAANPAKWPSELQGKHDFIFYGAESDGDLAELKRIIPALKKSGALWIVYPKGRKDITESDVFAAGKRAGLVDVKVARFSATHTALKFVIPVDKR